MIPADLPPAIVCQVTAVPDADTVRCSNGQRIRIAGVSARERDGSCNSVPDCPTMRHSQAHPIAARIMLGRSIRFRVVGRSYDRLVGENREIRCALIASGAAARWDRYWRQYRLPEC